MSGLTSDFVDPRYKYPQLACPSHAPTYPTSIVCLVPIGLSSMDTSPLAAMQRSPPAMPYKHNRNLDLSPTPPGPGSFSNFGSLGEIVTPRSFNFGEMKDQKAGQDYFNSRHVRGSSPAALAADLSQNFHIDNKR